MKKWELTGEAFDLFLNWLDTDREAAGRKYSALHRRLVIFFNCRGCATAEELADETINRVVKQAPTLAAPAHDPTPYCYGVAKNVYHEHLRAQAKLNGDLSATEIPDPRRPEEQTERELIAKCLRQCLQKLSPENQQLFIRYYQVEKRAELEHRQALADELGCTVNALRIRVHRLKDSLRNCILNCCQRDGRS
jgi:RNA polymerase sigma factor (sigma-70 family)